jgi:hypothetical protein
VSHIDAANQHILTPKQLSLLAPQHNTTQQFGLEKAIHDPKLSAYGDEESRWSETTLNYWMMLERYPNLKEEVGGSNPGYEISSLPDGKLAMWLTTSCALALAC